MATLRTTTMISSSLSSPPLQELKIPMIKSTTQSSLAPMEKAHPPFITDMFEFTVQLQPNDTNFPPTPTFTIGYPEDGIKKKNQLTEENQKKLHQSKSMRGGCVSGSGRRSKKWQMFTLGPMKLQPEMEMDAIRNRQKRRSRSVGRGDHSGEGSWKILSSLSCKAAVDTVAQASPTSFLF